MVRTPARREPFRVLKWLPAYLRWYLTPSRPPSCAPAGDVPRKDART